MLEKYSHFLEVFTHVRSYSLCIVDGGHELSAAGEYTQLYVHRYIAANRSMGIV